MGTYTIVDVEEENDPRRGILLFDTAILMPLTIVPSILPQLRHIERIASPKKETISYAICNKLNRQQTPVTYHSF